MTRILITARSFRDHDGPHQQILRDAGLELMWNPLDRPLGAAEIVPLLAEADAAILGLDTVTCQAIERAPRLKVISRFGVGVDKVDVAAATERGVVVTVTPGANSVAVAELTIGLILALARHISHHDRIVRAGGWTRLSGQELQGSTLGLIGFGRIGQEVARRAAAFDMRIIYCDPVAPPDELVAMTGAQARSLAALLAESDVVSLHVPLDDSTDGLIGAAQLACMKSTALLVNTSRGGLVDEAALHAALQAARLAGAAADVFALEPPGDNPLLKLDNFIATPHTGSATLQTTLRMGWMAARNALAVLEGKRPEHVVNPEVYYRLHGGA